MELIAARMIGGVAFGAALVLAPIYIAEIAPAKQRGQLVSIQQLNIVLGFSAAYFSNFWLQSSLEGSTWLSDSNVWRWMLGMECFPAILYFFALFLIPQSPRWLFTKGKPDKAQAILDRIHGPEMAQEEAAAIQENLRANQNQPKAV